jgi:hypothetical protein
MREEKLGREEPWRFFSLRKGGLAGGLLEAFRREAAVDDEEAAESEEAEAEEAAEAGAEAGDEAEAEAEEGLRSCKNAMEASHAVLARCR